MTEIKIEADAAPIKPLPEDLFRRALALWGTDSQLGMVQEECAELIAAVSQYKRGRISEERLAEEVADVTIMVAQLRLLLGGGVVDRAVEKKLLRLLSYVLKDEPIP
jgi:hypothetical protein